MATQWVSLSFSTTTSLSVCFIYLTSRLKTFGFLVCCCLFCSVLQSRAERAAAHAKQSTWFFSFVNCGFWGFVSWGAPDGPLRVDGGSWCELPPLTLIYCWVLGVCFMRGTRWATKSWWQLLMWAASSHSHLLLGSGGSFYEGAGWATKSWWWLLMWAASSHSHLLLGSGGSFYEGHQMGHYELMVALDVSCLLSPSFTSGFWGFISWGVPTCH